MTHLLAVGEEEGEEPDHVGVLDKLQDPQFSILAISIIIYISVHNSL
jgi:hypothetical protein